MCDSFTYTLNKREKKKAKKKQTKRRIRQKNNSEVCVNEKDNKHTHTYSCIYMSVHIMR